MRDYDYMVTVDRNGEPVISHALFGLGGGKGGNQKGSQRENHRYIARIEDKGKYLYFYTKEALENYYRGGKKKIEDATGITAKKNLEDANIFNKKKRQAAYDNSLLGKAEGALRGAKEKAGSMGSGLKSKAQGAVDSAKDKLGFDERERLEDANIFNKKKRQAAYDETALGKAEKAVGDAKKKAGDVASSLKENGGRTLSSLGNKAKGAVDSAKDKLGFDERERLEDANIFNKKKRQAAYDETVLGKAEGALRGAREKAEDAADSAREFGSKLKTKTERMREDLRKGAEAAGDKVSEATEKVSGSKAKKDYEKAQKAYQAARGTDDELTAYYEMVEAQRRYEKTLGGKVSSRKK